MLSLPSGRTEKTPGLVQKDPLWFQRKGQRQKRWASEYCECYGLCYLGQTRKWSLRLGETFGGFPQSGKVLDGVEYVISSLYGPWTERVNSFWPYIFQRKDLLTSSVASSSSSSHRLPPLPVPAFCIQRKAVTRASDPIISHTELSSPHLHSCVVLKALHPFLICLSTPCSLTSLLTLTSLVHRTPTLSSKPWLALLMYLTSHLYMRMETLHVLTVSIGLGRGRHLFVNADIELKTHTHCYYIL